MDAAHRDRLAFVRVCSGIFERGMVVTHAGTGKPFATKYAQPIFGRDRATVDTAYPGDVIGLVNATLAARRRHPVRRASRSTTRRSRSSRRSTSPSPAASDSGRYKQFRRGIEQLEQEGVVQVLRSDLRGDQAPVFAAVGPMQFEVATHRLETEFKAADQARAPRLHGGAAARRAAERGPQRTSRASRS